MANVAGYFGFQARGTASGPPNFAENHNQIYRIASNNATAIFYGDLVRPAYSGSPTGYLTQWTAGDGASQAYYIPSGIFVGCSYYSASQQKTIEVRYWPGSDAVGDVSAYVIDDPNAQFVVQANSTAITQTSLGMTADIASTPVGNTTTGISGMSLAAPTISSAATLPFKVVNLVTTPPGANGTDITTSYNYVVVAFNNQQYKSLLGL